ncbi:hypothetical protein RMSM_05702, partial [Rhodopirellula maiorica SM1]
FRRVALNCSEQKSHQEKNRQGIDIIIAEPTASCYPQENVRATPQQHAAIRRVKSIRTKRYQTNEKTPKN